MPELSLYFLNNTSYPDATYEPPFTFVGDTSALKYTIYCSVNCDFGFRWCVDNQYQVISTDTYSLTGGTEQSITVPITARYVQIFVDNIASNPCDLKTQVFFLTNFCNFGCTGATGIQGVTGATGAQGPTGVGSNVTLGSSGGVSTVVDGIGPSLIIKGLTGSSNIDISDNGDTLLIDYTGVVGVSPYQQLTTNLITPVTPSVNSVVAGFGNTSSITSTNNLLSGTSNSILGSVNNSSILGGNINSMNNTVNKSGILGGHALSITGSAQNSNILGGDTQNITSSINCGILCGESNSITSASNNVIAAGASNIITNPTNSCIIGSEASSLVGSRTNNCMIGASISSKIDTSDSNGDGKNCIILGCKNSNIGLANEAHEAGSFCGLFCSSDSLLRNRGYNNIIIGCTGCSVNNEALRAGIYSSLNCQISGNRTSTAVISCCNNCYIRTSDGSGDGDNISIIGSRNSQIGTPSQPNAGIASGIYSSINCVNTGRNQCNSILSGNSCAYNTNVCDNSVICGQNVTCGHLGNFIFSDSAGGTPLGSTGANMALFRTSGGATFYSNTANTTYVHLASGGNSWSSSSDKNLKENLINLDDNICKEMADKFYNIPIYRYNFIGNPKEQICYGPLAQDWNSLSNFGCENVTKQMCYYERDENGTLQEKLMVDEQNNPVYETKPAKDCLRIETMDMIGIMMATIKHLQNRVKQLEAELVII